MTTNDALVLPTHKWPAKPLIPLADDLLRLHGFEGVQGRLDGAVIFCEFCRAVATAITSGKALDQSLTDECLLGLYEKYFYDPTEDTEMGFYVTERIGNPIYDQAFKCVSECCNIAILSNPWAVVFRCLIAYAVNNLLMGDESALESLEQIQSYGVANNVDRDDLIWASRLVCSVKLSADLGV